MDFYRVDVCRSRTGCRRAVSEVKDIIKVIEEVLQETDFNNKRKRMVGEKVKQHHLFKIGIAGCANCCSQPQIKDFAVVAKRTPVYNKELCNLCGACVKACRENALTIVEDKLFLQESLCLGCGDCWSVCLKGALKPGEENWRLLIGGKLGRHPQFAREIGQIKDTEVKEYLTKAINLILNSSSLNLRPADLLAQLDFSEKEGKMLR